jgi:hypothetical protein
MKFKMAVKAGPSFKFDPMGKKFSKTFFLKTTWKFKTKKQFDFLKVQVFYPSIPIQVFTRNRIYFNTKTCCYFLIIKIKIMT